MKALLGIALAAAVMAPAHAGDREPVETTRIVVSDLRDRSQLPTVALRPTERITQGDSGSTVGESAMKNEPRNVRVVGPSFFPDD